MHSIDSFIVSPLLSAILSCLLFLSLNKIGFFFLHKINVNAQLSERFDLRFHYPLIGALFLNFLLFFLVLLNLYDSNIIKILSLILVVIGIFSLRDLYKSLKLAKFRDKNDWLIFIILSFFFLLCLAPITGADALSYHSNLSLYLINNNHFPDLDFWFYSKFAGSVESLNTIGLIIGAEQFTNLVQYSALLSISGYLINKKKLLLLTFLSTPILIFLVTSSKPQLLGLGFTSFAIVLILNNYLNYKRIYFFIIFLAFNAYIIKFNFIISSFLIWLLASKNFFKENLKVFFQINFFFILFLIIFIHYKINHLHFSFIDALLNPLPMSLPGYIDMYESIKSSCSNNCTFFGIFLPKNLGHLTQSFGFVFIIFIIFFLYQLIKKKIYIHFKYFLFFIIIYLVILIFYGSYQTRFYFEIYIWLIIFFSTQKLDSLYKSKFLQVALYFQVSLIILILSYSIFILAPGFFSHDLRKSMLSRYADGYQLAKWTESKVPINSTIIYSYRQVSSVNLNVINVDFMNHSGKERLNFTKYFNEIKNLKPEYYLIIEDGADHFRKCKGEIVAKSGKIFSRSFRNIFNSDNKKYGAVIYKINFRHLPDCAY